MQLHRWDVSYYSERLRERRYDVDQEALRKYFPMPQTLDWLLHVSSRVFGVRFEAAAVPVWHEDVRYYDVIDARAAAQIGGIYCDLYPREGKFTHAAAWPVRGASTRAGRTPITVMVANFDRRGLTHDEVETFFHEFGHVLHGVLSETHYNQHAGTNVERDFVEAPSQIYEEWARRLESLATIRDVCPDCPVMDAALVDRLNAARRFGAGMQYAPAAPLRVLRHGALRRAPAAGVRDVEGDGGGDAAGLRARHELPGHLLAHCRRLRGRILRLHVGGGDRARHAVGVRREPDQPRGRDALPQGDPEPWRRGASARCWCERFLGRAVNNEAFLKEITGQR